MSLKPASQPSLDTLLPVRFALFNAQSVTQKTFILNKKFTDRKLDFLFLTETWLNIGDLSSFGELCPPQCSFFNAPRSSRGGGIATIFKDSFKCKLLPIESFLSFEVQLFIIHLSSPILCALVYRPPKLYENYFIEEFSDLVSLMAARSEKLLILGDINVHVCCPDKPLVKDFLNIIDSFNLQQSVSGPTHEKGHTLDLVLSSGLNILNTDIFMIGVSDHSMIVFEALLPPPTPTPLPSHHLTRSINPTTATIFSDTLMRSYSSEISNIIMAPTNTENLVSFFEMVSSKTLDRVAPEKLVRCKPKMVSTPWLNETARTLRQACRQAERTWKHDKLQISYDILKNSLKTYQASVKAAKSDYYANLINTHSNRPQVLFKTINSILNPATSAATTPTPDSDTCEKFKNFFTDKITNIRALIPCTTSYYTEIHPPASTFQSFLPVSSSVLSEAVSHLKPTSCPSDIIPSRLLKDVFATISPLILAIITSSLQSGVVPTSFKHATIQSLLKKPSLDPNDHNNYRPISKLPFLSKVLEKLFSHRYLLIYNLLLSWTNFNLVLEPCTAPNRHC